MNENTQPTPEDQTPNEPVALDDAPSPEQPAAPEAVAPEAVASEAAVPAAAPQAGPWADAPRRTPARFGKILWGVLLLVFAAYMLSTVLMPAWLDPVTWITAGLIVVGLVLVVAGIAAASRRA